MAQEFHFQHHRLEAKRNRLRLSVALVSVLVATASVGAQKYVTDAATVVSYNDATVGTGLGQFEFVSTWNKDTPAGAYNNDNHFSNAAGAFYQFRFSGTTIKILGEKNFSVLW